MYELAGQLVRLAHTTTGMVAIAIDYNQITFYILSSCYLITAILFIIGDSRGKARLVKEIIRLTPDVCGYRKVDKLNELVAASAASLFCLTFAATFLFYIARDEFILGYYSPLHNEI